MLQLVEGLHIYIEIWEDTMTRVVKGLKFATAFTLCDKPLGTKAISNEFGEAIRAKARLIARRLSQSRV